MGSCTASHGAALLAAPLTMLGCRSACMCLASEMKASCGGAGRVG